ncbi:hypothetical protein [Methylobacterium segetis]|uniref:hypothetical protein n=1 Tax=Methylobacterium segetis TaxID=2488750 RepID=UPI00104EEA76|nr:hypothetical protein [Methylobacterium segetis]
MSESGNPQKDGRSLPDDIAAAAGMPSGPGAARSQHAGGGAGGTTGGNLDPHAQAQDFSLRPDSTGAHDPLGAARTDPHAKPQDFSFRPDAGGSRDPGGHAGLTGQETRSAAGDAAGRARGAASQAAGQASDLAGQARDRASDFASGAGDRLRGAADDVRERASEAYDDARTWISDMQRDQRRRVEDLAARGQDRLRQHRSSAELFVQENPLLVGVVGLAAGLLLGALLPRTRSEDRNLGPYADELRGQGLRYARDFADRGREFVENALDPDNLNATAQRAGAQPGSDYQGEERAAHRL